ncbi:MAG: hypothetical protein AAGG51_08940 [Cyanobacteria bacterium P01_G01_bin.54]
MNFFDDGLSFQIGLGLESWLDLVIADLIIPCYRADKSQRTTYKLSLSKTNGKKINNGGSQKTRMLEVNDF